MPICKKQSYYYPIFIACFIIIMFLMTWNNTKYPETKNVAHNITALKDLIGWGLKRQTTHAALTLSAFVSLFSILRFKKCILEKHSIQIIYGVFLVFLSYEYFKLLRSFQIVALWEEALANHYDIYYEVFKSDWLQKMFFSNVFLQTFGLFLMIFFASRMYILTMHNND